MIVVDESFTHEGIPMRFVHHREFPEIRCEGETTIQRRFSRGAQLA
jgi:hypothetical protein